MNIWSQIARLGAAIAALGPPILTKAADDEPEQVEAPTLGITDQPIAEASIEASAVDADANLLEDMAVSAPTPYIAAMPAALSLPTAPDGREPAPRRDRAGNGAKPRVEGKAQAPRFPGGGQRYG